MMVPSGTFSQNPEYSLTKNFLRPSAQIFNYCASMHYVFKTFFNNKIVCQMRVSPSKFFNNPKYIHTQNFLRASAQIFNYCASMRGVET